MVAYCGGGKIQDLEYMQEYREGGVNCSQNDKEYLATCPDQSQLPTPRSLVRTEILALTNGIRGVEIKIPPHVIGFKR